MKKEKRVYAKAREKSAALWREFQELVRDFIIGNDGIASMNEVFGLGQKVFKKLVWSTPKLEEIARYLVSCGECFRIDLNVPGGKPLQIYPGHHKLSSTTFFVLTREDGDHSEDVAKATVLLAQLADRAKETEKEKKKKKPAKQTEAENAVPDAEQPKQLKGGLRSKGCQHFGYISMKRVQMQIFHQFLVETFGNKHFSLKNVKDSMSVDLIMKLIGFTELPSIFLIEPKLRSIVYGNLPAVMQIRIEEECDYEKNVGRLLAGAIRGPDYCFITGTETRMRLDHSIEINFLGHFKRRFEIRTVGDVLDFHKLMELVELMENIDPHSYALWNKRYGLMLNGRNASNKIVKAIIDDTMKPPYSNVFPVFHYEVEDFVKSTGQMWANLQSYLLQLYSNPDVRDSVKVKKRLRDSRIAMFLDGTLESDLYPCTMFDKMTIDDFRFLAGGEAARIYNYTAAMSVLLPNGVASRLPRMWTTMLEYIEQLTDADRKQFTIGLSPGNLHQFFMNNYKDYKDIYHYNMAKISHDVINKVSESGCEIELMTSEYNDHMNISSRRLLVKPTVGELIERVKMVSICPKETFALGRAKTLLGQIRNEDLDEAIFYLKISRFLTQKYHEGAIDRSSRFSCARRALYELELPKPLSFYQGLVDYAKLAKNPDLKGLIRSNMSSCVYFCSDDPEMAIEIELPEAAMIDITASNKRIERQSMTDVARKARGGLGSGVDLSVKSVRIGLPELPEFECETVLHHFLESRPVADFRSYPGCTCSNLYTVFMQIYVVLYQFMYQVRPVEDIENMTVVSRLIYGFIMGKYSEGVSVCDILNEYGAYGMEVIMESLAFLEQFEYIYKIHSIHVYPIYVADIYANSHLITHSKEVDGVDKYELVRPHFWTTISGDVDGNILVRLQTRICDLIDQHPGIEILDLCNVMTCLNIDDLIRIVDVMEDSEVIYSMYSKVQTSGLDCCETEVPCAPVDSVTFQYYVGENAKDPLVSRIKRKLYVTRMSQTRLAESLSVFIGDDNGEKLLM